MKNTTPTKLPQLLLNFLAIPNRKKIYNEHFNLCEKEISLDVSSLDVSSEFARGVFSPCCYTLLRLRYLPISLILIK